MKITFIDTETTGLPKHFPGGDGPEITEYCLATWDDGKVSDVTHVLVMPQNAPPADKEGICRAGDGFPLSYRPDEWKAAKAKPWGADDNRRMFAALHGCYIGGSNPRFDIDRVRWEVDRFSRGGPRFEHHHRVMDLNALGYPLWVAGLVESTGLVALAKYFGIKHDAHTSNGDVLASIAVFERLLDRSLRHDRMLEFCREVAELYGGDEDPSLAKAAEEASA
jgi:DNA polymerase III epsilon subunit-like protein